jgi:predicted DNA-binding transcriptional regulator
VLREDALKAWLESEIRKLLPQRSHRKLGVKRLLDFLQRTQGSWFRLKDFELHFGVDRKTAWEYLQKFLSAGLLRHNQERSAAVRYALATRFLVVLADTLEPKVLEALPDLPQKQADQVCDWLVATGGEPFGEAEWHVHLKGSRCRQIIATLQTSGLLEEVSPAGLGQRFQLPRRWLQD